MRHHYLLLFLAATGLAACDDTNGNNGGSNDMAMHPGGGAGGIGGAGGMGGTGGMGGSTAPDDMAMDPKIDENLKTKVQNIVVIYLENRSFDNIFGTFPCANGIPTVDKIAPQTDRDSANTVFTELPVSWGGLLAAGQPNQIDQTSTAGRPNAPFAIDDLYHIDYTAVTRDLWHLFFQNQMQIDGGKNDKFVAYADSGGQVMGHFDGSKMALWKVAQDYVLADNFYQAAFGGSFLNHQSSR